MRTIHIVSIVMCILSLVEATFSPLEVMCTINGHFVPAMVDSGAEISVFSMEFAKRCQLADKVDKRYFGTATGIGSSEILGLIKNVELNLGSVKIVNNISVLKQSKCAAIIGLDILDRYNCDISIGDRTLFFNINGRKTKIPLLPKRTDDRPVSVNMIASSGWRSDVEDGDDEQQFDEHDQYSTESTTSRSDSHHNIYSGKHNKGGPAFASTVAAASACESHRSRGGHTADSSSSVYDDEEEDYDTYGDEWDESERVSMENI